jgi:hypothetical protein
MMKGLALMKLLILWSFYVLAQVSEIKYSADFPRSHSDDLNIFIVNAKIRALSTVFPTMISSKQEEAIREERIQNEFNFTSIYTSQIISSVNGVWVKDLSQPEIIHTKRGREKWVTVNLHGLVARKPNKGEARELLINLLLAKPLSEGVQWQSVEYYPSNFLVSVAVLDRRKHNNPANIDIEARMIAESNLLNSELTGDYRKSYGWVPSLEYLTKLPGDHEHLVVYIFIQEVAE